jgi:hypothetical protein
MTDFHHSMNATEIQLPPIGGTAQDDDDVVADCYQLRTELIAAEAAAASEQEAEVIIDRRLEADDAVWSAVIRDEQDILTKIDVLRCLVQSMTAEDMLPLIAELHRQVEEFAQGVAWLLGDLRDVRVSILNFHPGRNACPLLTRSHRVVPLRAV